jgi:hypothetical protein
MDHSNSTLAPPAAEGPGCGHELCLFERDCLVVQAEAERVEAELDRTHRAEMGAELADRLGLGPDEGRLLEVIAYSPDLAARIAAADELVEALWRIARGRAA